MIWLYRLLFLPGLLVLIPRIAARMRKRGGYREDWKQRFGRLPDLPPKREGVQRYWLQAVSVGEIQALEPLIEAWSLRPDLEIYLTTTTSTGYRLARQRYSGRVLAIGLFPVDFWPWSARAWRTVQPDRALLMESELWPEHLHQARRRGIPVTLLNARLSDRSYRRYRRWPAPARWVMGGADTILAATGQDAERFRALSPRPENVNLTGNLKLDVDPGPQLGEAERETLRRELGFTAEGAAPLILLGASTWDPEENFLLKVQAEARARGLDCRLLLIPRHAERREEIMALLRDQPLPWAARSQENPAPPGLAILLADTTGEMRRLIQVADVAFIGKSLPPNTEGQTPLECAALGLPSVTGPGMSNFQELVRSLEGAGGCQRGADAEACAALLLELLSDVDTRRQAGAAATAWHRKNRGAVQRILKALESAPVSSTGSP